MSDNEKTSTEDFPIDPLDVAFLDHMHPGTDVCPVCKHTQWYIMQSSPQVLPLLPMAGPDTGHNPVSGLQLLVLSCQRCGFIRSHALGIVTEYIKELKKEPGDDAGS